MNPQYIVSYIVNYSIPYHRRAYLFTNFLSANCFLFPVSAFFLLTRFLTQSLVDCRYRIILCPIHTHIHIYKLYLYTRTQNDNDIVDIFHFIIIYLRKALLWYFNSETNDEKRKLRKATRQLKKTKMKKTIPKKRSRRKNRLFLYSVNIIVQREASNAYLIPFTQLSKTRHLCYP